MTANAEESRGILNFKFRPGAVDLGYFDQAHLIKDFRALVGKTPTEYAKQIRQDVSRPTPTRRV